MDAVAMLETYFAGRTHGNHVAKTSFMDVKECIGPQMFSDTNNDAVTQLLKRMNKGQLSEDNLRRLIERCAESRDPVARASLQGLRAAVLEGPARESPRLAVERARALAGAGEAAQAEALLAALAREGPVRSEAARALGISERTLRKMLPGLPHVHLGGAVVLPVVLLEEWLRSQAQSEKSRAEGDVEDILDALKAGPT